MGGTLQATPSPTVDSPMDELIETGLRAMYNLDYPASRAAFEELEKRYPHHPIGLYGQTTALWWELTNDYDENDAAMEQKFRDMAEKTIATTTVLMKDGDPSGIEGLCLGGTYGLEGRWDAIQGHWLKAYRNGKRAFNLQTDAIQRNPTLYDAYLGPGIFHYYTAVLPSVAKFLAHMVFGGSKEQGLNEIRLSMDKGVFSKTAARLFMVNLLVNNEKNPTAALALLREERAEYPQSPFFHHVELLVLEEAKDWTALDQEARDYLDKIATGAPYYDTKKRHLGLLALGNSALGRGQAPEAISFYNQALDQAGRDDRWVSLTYLNRGKARDLLGQRDQALSDYRVVMTRRDVWSLHDKTEVFLKKPYTMETPKNPEKKP